MFAGAFNVDELPRHRTRSTFVLWVNPALHKTPILSIPAQQVEAYGRPPLYPDLDLPPPRGKLLSPLIKGGFPLPQEESYPA